MIESAKSLMARRIVYSEPGDYFPESVRKELGIGEYAKKEDDTEVETQENNDEDEEKM